MGTSLLRGVVIKGRVLPVGVGSLFERIEQCSSHVRQGAAARSQARGSAGLSRGSGRCRGVGESHRDGLSRQGDRGFRARLARDDIEFIDLSRDVFLGIEDSPVTTIDTKDRGLLDVIRREDCL